MRCLRNAVRCKKCHTLLVSERTRHFSMCPCGVWVDGGAEQPRSGWPSGEKADWIDDQTLYTEEPAPAITTLTEPFSPQKRKERDLLAKFFD